MMYVAAGAAGGECSRDSQIPGSGNISHGILLRQYATWPLLQMKRRLHVVKSLHRP